MVGIPTMGLVNSIHSKKGPVSNNSVSCFHALNRSPTCAPVFDHPRLHHLTVDVLVSSTNVEHGEYSFSEKSRRNIHATGPQLYRSERCEPPYTGGSKDSWSDRPFHCGALAYSICYFSCRSCSEPAEARRHHCQLCSLEPGRVVEHCPGCSLAGFLRSANGDVRCVAGWCRNCDWCGMEWLAF